MPLMGREQVERSRYHPPALEPQVVTVPACASQGAIRPGLAEDGEAVMIAVAAGTSQGAQMPCLLAVHPAEVAEGTSQGAVWPCLEGRPAGGGTRPSTRPVAVSWFRRPPSRMRPALEPRPGHTLPRAWAWTSMWGQVVSRCGEAEDSSASTCGRGGGKHSSQGPVSRNKEAGISSNSQPVGWRFCKCGRVWNKLVSRWPSIIIARVGCGG